MRHFWLVLALGICCGGCGEGETAAFEFDESVPLQLQPYVARITPTTAKTGDTITIVGFGYSVIPNQNAIVLDTATVAAESYAVAPAPAGTELEQLTFQVPSTLAVGTYSVGVVVYDNSSNNEQTLTIIP